MRRLELSRSFTELHRNGVRVSLKKNLEQNYNVHCNQAIFRQLSAMKIPESFWLIFTIQFDKIDESHVK